MFLKIRPLLYSIFFFLGLEAVIWEPKFVWAILVFLFCVSLLEGKRVGGRMRYSILPSFFTLSSITLLYLIALSYEQQIFIVLSSGMYYLALYSAYRLGKYDGDKTALGMNIAASSATIFFIYSGSYGVYLNFLVSIFYLMAVYVIVTFLVSYQYFSIINNDRKKVVVYSFILSFAMAEIIWALNFWPFGYLTTGVIALTLYYVIWDLTHTYFLNRLSKRRIVARLVFFSFIIAMVLLSSKWIPVI